MSTELEELKNRTFNKRIIEYSNKSDKELAEISSRCLSKVQRASSAMETAQLFGESEACQSILRSRRQELSGLREAQMAWSKTVRGELEKAAILNLENTATSNGQLVLAILEDEASLSAEELSGWCDELGSLPDEELKKLLNGMVREGALREEGGRYALDLCSTAWLTDDPRQWLLERAMEYGLINGRGKKFGQSIVEAMARCPFKAIGLMSVYKEILKNRSETEEIDWAEYEEMGPDIGYELLDFEKKGLLVRRSVNDVDLYTLPILGEDKEARDHEV